MGIVDGDIKASHENRLETVKLMLKEIITEDDEILTILQGEESDAAEMDALIAYIEAAYEDIEIEVHEGNQPIYSYIFAVE